MFGKPCVTEFDDVIAASAHHEEELSEGEAVRLGPVPARLDRVAALFYFAILQFCIARS